MKPTKNWGMKSCNVKGVSGSVLDSASRDVLVSMLFRETAPLKESFLDATQKSCESRIAEAKVRSEWSEEDWCKFLRIEPRRGFMWGGVVKDHKFHVSAVPAVTFPVNFYNGRMYDAYRSYQAAQNGITIALWDKFTESELKWAVTHYEASIHKLADRLMKKGLNLDNLTFHTSSVGANIETLISDGSTTVRAWTILASGPVQRPHYRYLVK